MSAIEIDPRLLGAMPLPTLANGSDKEDRGRVLVVAGGAAVPGAAILTGLASLRVGAGKLQLAAIEAGAAGLGLAVPEARIISVRATASGEMDAAAADDLVSAASRSDAVVTGPGMMEAGAAGALAGRLLAAAESAIHVIDAAALEGLRGLEPEVLARAAGRMILTPHAGEMAQLLGCDKAEVLDDLAGAARRAAAELQAVVVMKSQETFVASPDGRTWRHGDGPVGLGTSGSGDVLAGVIGGLAARGAPPSVAAIWGVWLHGRAGVRLTESIGPLGFLARELLLEMPGALEDVRRLSAPAARSDAAAR